MAKQAYYFKHDSNALHDPKISQMRLVYGMEGFGLYWALIGMMREQDGYKLPISGKYAIEALAKVFDVPAEKLQKYIDSCCEEFTDDKGGLFCKNDSYVWSESLIRRMVEYDYKSAMAQEAARIRWSKQKGTPKSKRSFGTLQNVFLLDKEYEKLKTTIPDNELNYWIEQLSAYIGKKGTDPFESHYRTILKWHSKEKPQSNTGKSKGIKIVK